MILAAMEIERRLLLEKMRNPSTRLVAPWLEAVDGELDGVAITLVQMGIGKVNAGVATALLLVSQSYDLVVNTGVAGGLVDGLSVGDVVISDELIYHDVDARTFGYALGQVPGMSSSFVSKDSRQLEALLSESGVRDFSLQRGIILSGDQFIAQEADVVKLLHHFPDALAVEMEGAAVAHVASLCSTPFIVIRALSDKANGQAQMSYEEFLELASRRSAQIVRELLNGTKEKNL
nr:5'-methylthioadenosine/adenosylhomocysteine nucleosidase [Entomospira culicis]